MTRTLMVVACVVLLIPSLTWGQQELRSGLKGATNPSPVTSTDVDADTQALDVYIKGGAAPGGGSTQYDQGTVTTDTDALMMAGCVRADTAAVATGVADGDRARCIVDATGRIWVHVGAIDGTVAVTQSGTWNLTNISGTISLPTGAATAANQDGIVRDGAGDTTQANVSSGRLHVDGSEVTQPVSGTVTANVNTFPDNEPFNMAQINGVTPLMGAGNTGTGSPRVTIATDQAAMVGLAIYTEDLGETASGNLAMAGSVRRDVAASSAGTTGDNATINTDATGLLWTRTIDPCSSTGKTYLPINISTATTTEITPSLAGASNYYYVCSLVLVTASANNVAVVDDDSDGCGSVTAGMAGGTTAASGFNLAANGGLTFGNGMGSVFKTNGTNRVVCLVTSAATQLSGTMTVVSAP